METASSLLNMENFHLLGSWGISLNLSEKNKISPMSRLTLHYLLFGADSV